MSGDLLVVTPGGERLLLTPSGQRPRCRNLQRCSGRPHPRHTHTASQPQCGGAEVVEPAGAPRLPNTPVPAVDTSWAVAVSTAMSSRSPASVTLLGSTRLSAGPRDSTSSPLATTSSAVLKQRPHMLNHRAYHSIKDAQALEKLVLFSHTEYTGQNEHSYQVDSILNNRCYINMFSQPSPLNKESGEAPPGPPEQAEQRERWLSSEI